MPDHAPYADPEPLTQLIEECRCAEEECASHGVDLHPEHHDAPKPAAPPSLVVTDEARHLVDGMSDYGS